MIRSLRKLSPAERRELMILEVKGVLERAKKASRFLGDEYKVKLKEAEEYLKKAEQTVVGFSAPSRNVDRSAMVETFNYIRNARDIAKKIDAEGERLAKELKDI